MKVMFRPLVISPCFFTNDAVSQVERHFFLNLDPNYYRPIILCASYDDKYKNVNADVYVIKENKFFVYLEKILRNLCLTDITRTPDYKRYSWNPFVKKMIMKLNKTIGFDYIHTISFPCSTHLLGDFANKISGKPWIAQFYDPWVDNPLRPIKNSLFLKYDQKLEYRIACNSSLVLHSNSSIVDSWNNRYPLYVHKIKEIPFITNEKGHVPKSIKRIDNKPVIISHIGSLYAGRTAKSLIFAINKLSKSFQNLEKIVHFVFVGTVTEDDMNLIKALSLEMFFTFTGRIDELECMKYYEEADYFLAIDSFYNYNCFFPSKILKYFSYAKPIIGIVKKGSVLEAEIERSSNIHVDLENVDGISSIIKDIAEGKNLCPNYDVNYWKKFSIDNVLSIYHQIVMSITADK